MSVSVEAEARAGGVVAVFAVTVFLSASLLFFVQPMYAKMVLPHLGGAPAVWTTAMLFFQTALLTGYAYAHFLSTRLALRRQVAVHGLVWASGLAFLPIAIPDGWAYEPGSHPAGQTLMLFALGVGMPFVALAANAPLLQKWYAQTGGPSADDPYHLYAASNAGSLIALLGYPLVAERIAGARDISSAWAALYLVLGIGLALCALRGFRGVAEGPALSAPAERYRPTAKQYAVWIGLAFVPSSMMLGVTSTISTDLGAFPLVWVIPLSLYLLTFILAFSARLRPPEPVVAIVFVVSLIAVIALLTTHALSSLRMMGFGALFLAFFSVTLLFHMRLHSSRPPEAGLTPFYFAMAAGGALGGLFNSVLAPVLFDDAVEVLVVFALAGLALEGRRRPLRDLVASLVAVLLACSLLLAGKLLGLYEELPQRLAVMALIGLTLVLSFRQPLRFAATAALFLAIGYVYLPDAQIVYRDRSFFGIYTVREYQNSGIRALMHGTTTHGTEFVEDMDAREPRILSYYHPQAPLGQIFRSGVAGPRARVGVVGLGAGALACYRQPGQDWRFFEIDGLIDDIARDPTLFTYMERCAGDAPTILGDARLALAREGGAPFDVLVIDAYSSDAIPVHLITLESLNLYFSRLAPDGVLALHVSNRFYDLAPILANAAAELGASSLYQYRRRTDSVSLGQGESPSEVVVMAMNPEALAAIGQSGAWQTLEPDGGPVWTDDYASPLDAL